MFARSGSVFCALFFIIILVNIAATEAASRQKRCIVVQKQSGSRDVDDEDDEDYRLPQPKDPRPDRLRADAALDKRFDVEDIPARLLNLVPKEKGLKNKRMFRKQFKDLYKSDLSPYTLF